MGKNKGYRSMIAAMTSFLLLAVLIVSTVLGLRVVLKYRLNGILTEAEVTVAEKHGMTYRTESSYYDENGRMHLAETTFNGVPTVGEKFEGYYLPEEPGKLYRMPHAGLIAAFASIWVILMLVCIIVFIKSIRTHRGNRLLSVHGEPVKARVLAVSRKGRSFVSNCLVSFTDGDGILQNTTVTFNKSIPAVDQECTVLYCKTKKGRLICDLIEL